MLKYDLVSFLNNFMYKPFYYFIIFLHLTFYLKNNKCNIIQTIKNSLKYLYFKYIR